VGVSVSNDTEGRKEGRQLGKWERKERKGRKAVRQGRNWQGRKEGKEVRQGGKEGN